MLSIDFIRQNKEKVAQAALNKNRKVDVEKLLMLDDRIKSLSNEIQALREERNHLAKLNDAEKSRERGKEIKAQLKKIEDELSKIKEEFNALMLYVPNIPLDEVPVGKDDTANVEIKKWKEPTTFDFAPKTHIELAEMHDLIDFERGSKISGFRGYFLKNQLAQLHFGLLFYVFQKLVAKGYTPIIAPTIVKEFTVFGSGHFPWGRVEDVYSLNDEDMFLSGTAEIPVTAYHSGETLSHKDLPKKFVALSPCYRREAGAYGKDTRGIYRVHEFWKIEQVIFGHNDLDEARKLHNELQSNTEEIIQELDIPYRVVLMSTGEMGEPQILKYDTDIWMPSREGYGEIGSNSIMGDFQARRLNIRYKDQEGKTQFCYTLNDTALPSPRILIALLENHQQKDGSIIIPEKIRPLVGFDRINS